MTKLFSIWEVVVAWGLWLTIATAYFGFWNLSYEYRIMYMTISFPMLIIMDSNGRWRVKSLAHSAERSG